MILKMDAEYSNDDSETWEDFFGSSVELGSSLLKLCNIPSAPRKPFKNLNVLSPNVQRILAHSKHNTSSETPSSTYCRTQCITKNTLGMRKTRGHNNFPLSGVASKISQSSVDLQINSDSDTIECRSDILTERYAPKEQMAAHGEQNVAENIPTEDVSLTSISDSNSQTSSPICRELKPGNMRFMRPLSTSSTDSSSSSTSTNNNRGGSQYLASIESLADHSDPDHAYEHRASLSVGERVCLEVINTEENYISDLKQVLEGYLESWRERSLLDDKKLETLFCNVQDIYNFNSKLLAELKTTENDPVKIAKCFIECNAGFNVYTKYCTNYPHAIALLTELLQAKDTASVLRETQSMLGHKLPLGSYLLKPVQRIMKYHLLLQNIYKNYENSYIERAFQLMTEVAHHIDEVKRHMEQQSRVQELEGSLDGWLGPSLTVLGELCLEGTLQERNHKSRQVFLFEKMLLITKRKEDGRLAYKSHIMCSNLMLVESIQGEPTSFHVIPYDNPRNQITLQARSVQQKKQWGLQLKTLMLEQFKREIPVRAKALVLGIDPDEETVHGTKRDVKKSHSTPDYLERRHERRRSEMSMRRLNKNRALTLDSNLISKPNDSAPVAADGKTPTGEEKRYSSWYLEEETSKELPYEQTSYSNDHLNTLNVPSLKARKADDKHVDMTDSDRSRPESALTSNDNVPQHSSSEQISLNNLHTDDSAKYLKPPIKSFEIKQYNTKTLPKKITKLKRNRTKILKTDDINSKSKFYTDLTPNDAVLYITESTEAAERGLNTKNSINNADIISQQHDLNKSENCGLAQPSSSNDLILSNFDNTDENNHDHIYEKLKVDNEITYYNDDVGENDYVVLDELKSELKEKQEDNMKQLASELQELFLENLQDNFQVANDDASSKDVSLENVGESPSHESRRNSNTLLQRIRSFREEPQQKKSGAIVRKSVLNLKPKTAIYKQGKDRLGYRFANVDYADPQLLFKGKKISNVPNRSISDTQITNKEAKHNTTSHKVNTCAISVEANLDDGFYEKSVEDSLEIFRDSAIYSDDNRYSKADVNSKNNSDQDNLLTKQIETNTTLPVNSENEVVNTSDDIQPQTENIARNRFTDGWVKQVVGKFQ